jgi:hypothetical protein
MEVEVEETRAELCQHPNDQQTQSSMERLMLLLLPSPVYFLIHEYNQ